MKLEGYVARNGINVEDVDSEDIVVRKLVESVKNELTLFIDEKPIRDENGFEEWYQMETSNYMPLSKHEWGWLTWEDEPVKVEVEIKTKGE